MGSENISKLRPKDNIKDIGSKLELRSKSDIRAIKRRSSKPKMGQSHFLWFFRKDLFDLVFLVLVNGMVRGRGFVLLIVKDQLVN